MYEIGYINQKINNMVEIVEKKLKPLYKWTGGKRKEIKVFSKYYPDFVKENIKYKFVEPFFGGGAVYWDLNADNNVINDIDVELVNFLINVKNNSTNLITLCNDTSEAIKNITDEEKSLMEEFAIEKKQLKTELIDISDDIIADLDERKSNIIKEYKTKRGLIYYDWRNKDRNNGLSDLSDIDRAFRFLLVNQLAFNGMRRFNSKGEFNIPYGNYKTFNPQITKEHVNKLRDTEVHCGSYKTIMENNDTDNTFIYLDPPYTREFKEYSHNNVFGEEQQIELFNTFASMKNASVMIIINKDDFTTNLYKDYIKDSYELKYSTNIKNRFNNSVEHLVITNY